MGHGNLRQLLADDVKVSAAGIDVDVLPGKNADKAVEGLLELRPARTEKVDELLWKPVPATWPEPSALAACKNHTIVVLFRSHYFI